MSIPIGATPTLEGKEASDFLERIYKESKIPSYPIPTPKLKLAEELIRKFHNAETTG